MKIIDNEEFDPSEGKSSSKKKNPALPPELEEMLSAVENMFNAAPQDHQNSATVDPDNFELEDFIKILPAQYIEEWKNFMEDSGMSTETFHKFLLPSYNDFMNEIKNGKEGSLNQVGISLPEVPTKESAVDNTSADFLYNEYFFKQFRAKKTVKNLFEEKYGNKTLYKVSDIGNEKVYAYPHTEEVDKLQTYLTTYGYDKFVVLDSTDAYIICRTRTIGKYANIHFILFANDKNELSAYIPAINAPIDFSSLEPFSSNEENVNSLCIYAGENIDDYRTEASMILDASESKFRPLSEIGDFMYRQDSNMDIDKLIYIGNLTLKDTETCEIMKLDAGITSSEIPMYVQLVTEGHPREMNNAQKDKFREYLGIMNSKTENGVINDMADHLEVKLFDDICYIEMDLGRLSFR